MRNNRVIGVAIAAALSLPLTMAEAEFFENVTNDGVNDTVNIHTNIVGTGVTTPVISSAGTVDANFQNKDGSAVAETVLSVPDNGIVYARELFSGGDDPTLPKTKYGAAVYTIDGQIIEESRLTFTLSAGSFQDTELALAMSGGGVRPTFDDPSPNGGSVTYSINDPNTNPKTDLRLNTGDQFLFLYKIKNADVLASPGGEIELSAVLKAPLRNITLNPERTVTVATSKLATTITLTDEPEGDVNVSVADGSKLFSGELEQTGGAYISPKKARIGYISIASDSTVMESDGENPFQIGGGTDAKLEDDDALVLEITGGQFAASGINSSAGRVYIDGVSGLPNADVTDENTATFHLSSAQVASLRTGTGDKVDASQKPTPTKASIVIEVDEETPINSVENPPEANLQINFDADSTISITADEILSSLNLPVELRQIKKDGMVCWIFNIPHSTANDIGNIRITNDSSATETISAKMFDTGGAAIGPAEGVILNGGDPLEAGQTIRLTAGDLETAGFPTWTGRAIMQLTTALPKIEVLNLLRQRGVSGAPLTNLSVGATGQSCESL